MCLVLSESDRASSSEANEYDIEVVGGWQQSADELRMNIEAIENEQQRQQVVLQVR